MNRNWLSKVARSVMAAASFITLGSVTADAQTEIVLHAGYATRIVGDWQSVSDGTAASGVRLWNPDRGAAKLTTASASPSDYFELTFSAEAHRPYRIWVRGKAENNAWTNDSLYLQFTNSLDPNGNAINRIGTASGMMVSLEACSGCGVANWGWEDNGYGGDGQVISFATGGQQTVRVQRREDGISVDQIVLSSGDYRYGAPGSNKNDSTILSGTSAADAPAMAPAPAPSPSPEPAPSSSTEIVLHTAYAAPVGAWQHVADSSAATGWRLWNPDRGAAKVTSPLAWPSDYFEMTFWAESRRPYRLWLRGKAENDSWTNDSVYVQFTNSLSPIGAGMYRIGTSSAAMVGIERCSGCGLSGWGWEDNGYAGDGEIIHFETTGPQTIRVQRREDGVSIDQIVLSAYNYYSRAPGAAWDDTTILTPGGTTSEPAPAPAPAPEPAPAPAPAPTPEPSPSGSTQIRIMQWNLHHSVGSDGVYSLERIADWMAALTPDIVLLNEVERYTSWGYEDQPERYRVLLEQRTGRRWYSHFAQEFGAWSSPGKGHQILSVFPFDSLAQTTITPSSGLGGAGAITQASLTINGRTVNILLTHLDPYSRDMRLIQAQDAIRWASGFAENRILAGDMNAWPDQTSIAELYQTYNDSWNLALAQGTAYASSSINPYGATKNGRIDYILVSRWAPNLVVLSSQVYDTRDGNGIMPSDHRPVVTTFDVR